MYWPRNLPPPLAFHLTGSHPTILPQIPTVLDIAKGGLGHLPCRTIQASFPTSAFEQLSHYLFQSVTEHLTLLPDIIIKLLEEMI